MAKMNDKQEALLSQLEDARVNYEKFEEDLAAEVANRKWEAKAQMRDLVREARGEGVPYRKIGFALQTSDHRTLKDYETNTRKDGR